MRREVFDLAGRKGPVVGIANQHSLAWSAAEHFRNASADVAVTFLKDKARPFVERLAQELSAPIFEPCDVSVPRQLEAMFEAIQKRWGVGFPVSLNRMGAKGGFAGTSDRLPGRGFRQVHAALLLFLQGLT